MSTTLSGPIFEPAEHQGMRSVFGKSGAHYNIYRLDARQDGRIDIEAGMRCLLRIFPNGEADEYNVCLFSTSGVHGSYTTIEDIEKALLKYGDDPVFPGEPPDDCFLELTVLVIHPRAVCMRFGNIRVRLADIDWLKRLRQTSYERLTEIGA